MNNETLNNLSWKLIDKYFTDNPNNLVAHHLESYNDFFKNGIHKIFQENNPILLFTTTIIPITCIQMMHDYEI